MISPRGLQGAPGDFNHSVKQWCWWCKGWEGGWRAGTCATYAPKQLLVREAIGGMCASDCYLVEKALNMII